MSCVFNPKTSALPSWDLGSSGRWPPGSCTCTTSWPELEITEQGNAGLSILRRNEVFMHRGTGTDVTTKAGMMCCLVGANSVDCATVRGDKLCSQGGTYKVRHIQPGHTYSVGRHIQPGQTRAVRTGRHIQSGQTHTARADICSQGTHTTRADTCSQADTYSHGSTD